MLNGARAQGRASVDACDPLLDDAGDMERSSYDGSAPRNGCGGLLQLFGCCLPAPKLRVLPRHAYRSASRKGSRGSSAAAKTGPAATSNSAVAAAAQSRLRERKVLLLGEDCVGKTTLAQRARGSIRSATTPTTTTIGIDVASATVATPEGPVKLRIWDTMAFTYLVNCGSREALGALLRGSAVVVLVFDVTRRASFEALKHIVAAVVDADNSEPPHGRRFLVVANKNEAPGREVSAEEAQRFAASLGDARSVEISAKTGTGVQQWLQLVAE
jgi:GTPase SAR1 family protein